MKHKLLLLGAMFTLNLSLQAEQVDSLRAVDIARNFISTQSGGMRKAPARNALRPVRQVSENSEFYIFNVGESEGFVIVSGDDNAIPVLGYATNGSFNTGELPPALEAWLEGYAEYVQYVRMNPPTRIEETKAVMNTEIPPLLGEIKWNQNAPFNLLIPDYLPTGCVATAGAQIMKYHEWPVRGTGSANSIDFSATEYDWKNMLPSYNVPPVLNVNRTAVATLMRDVGAAVNMKYAASGSAAADYDLAKALSVHFGYDKNIQEFQRVYYSLEKWKEILLAELTASQPVVYSGHSDVDGHTFVCDGYDGNDKFHMNWGWGGASDGYFALTQLVPSGDLGIGSGQGSFNLNQRMITGIRKPSDSTKPRYEITVDQQITSNLTNGLRTAEYSINIPKISNFGIIPYTGSLGLGLFQNGEMKADLASIDWNIPAQRILSNTSLTVTFPTSIADGTYELLPYYVNDNVNIPLLVKEDNQVALDVTLKEMQVTLGANVEVADLTMNALLEHSELVAEQPAEFRVKVRNDGDKKYNSTIGVFLFGINGTPNTWFQYTFNVIVEPKEEKTVTLKANAPATIGQYTASVRFDPTNSQSATLYRLEPASLSEKVVTVTLTSGVEETRQNAIRVNTDPTGDLLRISSPIAYQRLQIMNLAGMVITEPKPTLVAGEQELSIGHLPNGVYLLRVHSESEVRTFKFYRK